MNLKHSPLLVIILSLLLAAACSPPNTSPLDPEPSNNQDSILNRQVPIAVPTFTAPQPANLNPGKFIGTVYISDQDRKFHREDCSNLAPSNTPVPRQQAIIQGYTACPVCNP